MNAQQTMPLNEAFDFTATNCHGNKIHLFEIFDLGQYKTGLYIVRVVGKNGVSARLVSVGVQLR